MEDEKLERRAVTAWYRVEGTDCETAPTGAKRVVNKSLEYVVLEGEHSTLAVYRVRQNGQLKRLRRLPEWVDKPVESRNEKVYVIGPQRSNQVRIGVTSDPAKQLSMMQIGSPHPLEIVHTHPGGESLEGRLHKHFALFRTAFGWFDFGAANAKVLVERAIAEVGG